jgi:hypothetical protein
VISNKVVVDRTRRRRAGVLAALLVLAGLVGLQAWRKWISPGWTEVHVRDPRVGGIFQALHELGLAAALDSLEHQAKQDSIVLRAGHQLAHELGRQAFAMSNESDTVIAQCRADFASGCYHGVVEAFLAHHRVVDMGALEQICAGADRSPHSGSLFECVHGVGHGVLGATGGEVAHALRDCDALSSDALRGSCHEGVFMEAITAVIAGDGHVSGHAHGADAVHHGALTLTPGDPYSPCRQYQGRYGEACWLFQGFLILRSVGFDAGRALRVCDQAPTGWTARCYQSVGHQLTGLFQRDDHWVIVRCRSGRPDLGPQCAAGAVLARIAEDWSGRRARQFCNEVPEGWRDGCLGAYGRRMAARGRA